MTKRSGVRVASVEGRKRRAVEAFGRAAEAIGPIEHEMALFAVTRGQFSMIDAVLHTLDCVGPARISLWTWTVAEYEVQCLERLRQDERVTGGRLIIDGGARHKNAALIAAWKASYGPNSVRHVANHAKIATVETADVRVLLRGSMNLNFNPRFEQLDVTEGGADFDLVREIEDGLPVLEDSASNSEVWAASRLNDAFEPEQLKIFGKVKVWAK